MSTLEIDFNEFSNGSINSSNSNDIKWEGTGIFDNLMEAINGNVKVQLDSGRITGPDYAEVYLGAMQTAISEAMKFVLNKKSIEKALENADVDTAIKEVQLAESSEKWAIQKKVLENQLQMSDVDVAYKEQNVLRDLEIRDKQIESATADVEFNVSKKTIMEQTRKDNIRSKAAEQFAEFIKYLSAANVVPGANDFENMRKLINAMNTGIANPDVVATLTTVGADYVKP
jgi:hypothetical protein